jgi:catalase
VHIDARLADDTEVVNDRSVVTTTAAADEFPDQFVEEFAAALAPHRWWQRPTDPVPA